MGACASVNVKRHAKVGDLGFHLGYLGVERSAEIFNVFFCLQ